MRAMPDVLKLRWVSTQEADSYLQSVADDKQLAREVEL